MSASNMQLSDAEFDPSHFFNMDFGVLIASNNVCHFYFKSTPFNIPRLLTEKDEFYDGTRHIVEYRMNAFTRIIRFALAFPVAMVGIRWCSMTNTLIVPAAVQVPINDIIDYEWSRTYDERIDGSKHLKARLVLAPEVSQNRWAVVILSYEQKITKDIIPAFIKMVKSVFPHDNCVVHFDLVDAHSKNLYIEVMKKTCLAIVIGHGFSDQARVESDSEDARYVTHSAQVVADSLAALDPMLVLAATCYGGRSLIPELHRLLPDLPFFGYNNLLWDSTIRFGSFAAYLSLLLRMCISSSEIDVKMYRRVMNVVTYHQENSTTPLSILEALYLVALDFSRINPCFGLQSDLSEITLYNAKFLSYTVNFAKVQKLYIKYNQDQPLPKEQWKPIPIELYRAEYFNLLHCNTSSKHLRSNLTAQRKAAMKRQRSVKWNLLVQPPKNDDNDMKD